MTAAWITIAAILIASLASLMFSTLTYSLRDYSRTRLADFLAKRGKPPQLVDTIVENTGDYVFVTAIARLIANILILIGVLHVLNPLGWEDWLTSLTAVFITGIITLLCSVALPHALAQHAAEKFVGSHFGLLNGLRAALRPATRLMHAIDAAVASAIGASTDPATAERAAEQEIQQEILSVVEEGEKEGVVDEREREMIESVVRFRDTLVSQVMTARPDIVGLKVPLQIADVKALILTSGLSRVPVYEQSLDRITGVLYARDLLRHLGEPPERCNLADSIRPAFFVPETKPLSDLLTDFRNNKVHMAIVLDEFGATAGLITIEDVLEELVGDISDEHEPISTMLRRLDERTAEADARIRIDELNLAMELNLPEDAGYETLGGYVTSSLGRIPQTGAVFEQPGLKITVLDAEPQRVNRVKIELLRNEAEPEAAESVSTPLVK